MPKILEQHGIASEDVIRVEYSASDVDTIDVLVQLNNKEAIEKLGACGKEDKIGYDDAYWTKYRFIKYGISFICLQREGEAIA
ncbi:MULTISPECIES: hypothetical protein [unclassified Lysinibacillus]|uniref:hypothetical protein n=1 Tax=unclassified Lysinibacillus TaxID=2636778 RepID=UPI0037FA69A5